MSAPEPEAAPSEAQLQQPSTAAGARALANVPLGVFEAVFDASPSPMCVARLVDGEVMALNAAWVRATGVDRDRVKRHGLSAYGASFSPAVCFPRSADAVGDLDPRWVELISDGGVVRAVCVRVTEIELNGECLGLLTLLTAEPNGFVPASPSAIRSDDVAQANLILLRQVQLHPAMEKLARVGHWTNAENDRKLVWSQGLYEIAGMAPRDVLPQSEGRHGIHPDDLAAWLSAREALDGREVQYRWTRPNGELRWLRSRMGRSEVAGVAPVAFGVVQDITEEKMAQQALATELGFVNNIAAHVPGAIYRARRSKEGVASVSFVSPSSLDVLGVDAAEVIRDQRVFFSHIIPEDLPGLLALMDRTCEDLSVLRAVFRADIPNRGRRWIQAEAATQREADGATVWHGFLTDVTDRLEASKALERQHRMLQAIQASQATFIGLQDKRKAFEGLLASFLNVTDSAFGFVGEVLFDAQERPYLRMQALTDISWNDETRKLVTDSEPTGVEFRNLGTLFGHALRTGETVISNNPLSDQRSGGLPPGHPKLDSFLAMPIEANGRLVAMVGLANRAEGFEASDVAFLKPLLGTVRELVLASRAHAERQRSRLQFQATSALLAEKSAALQVTFDSMNQGMTMVDAEGRVRFYNQRLLELLNLPEELYANLPLHNDIVRFQTQRGDFGQNLSLLLPEVQPYIRLEPGVEPPERYVRRGTDGRALEVVTRMLPEGGFVRTYTDVTSYVDSQEALKDERQRLQWVLEATRPGIWETNLVTQECSFSERWCEMLGYRQQELMPTNLDTWRKAIHPDDVQRAERQRDLHIRGVVPYYECDLRMRHKSGQWVWVNDRGRVHRRDENGKALYMSGTLLDIHDRVAAQEEVRSLNNSLELRVVERTAELERTMKDMEAISYSIAHDLRAPLRSVNGFASLIAAEEKERLSPEALKMFERIARSSRNMGQMITDMLELLRVVRVDLVAVPVNMNEIAHSVSESLAPGTPNALIGIKPLPLVMGDATLLRQVLMNLMDNALKYARHRPQPELLLGFDERKRAFYLRDNGMGFDMARAGKLFGLFQRMHADSEVPGTGVGLAIVARIIERHGGRIWAEAIPNEGATFWWTLPRVSGN